MSWALKCLASTDGDLLTDFLCHPTGPLHPAWPSAPSFPVPEGSIPKLLLLQHLKFHTFHWLLPLES